MSEAISELIDFTDPQKGNMCNFQNLPNVFQLASKARKPLMDLQLELSDLRSKLAQAEGEKWINVKERLPKLDDEQFSENVLLFNGEEMAVGYYCYLHYWMTNIEDFETHKITHWMPLPRQPNKL